MTIAGNDSRWTAYVLDELDRFERVAFEKEMELVPEAEEILAEIRETVDLLQASREVIPITGLTPTARQRIEVAAVPTRSRSYARWAAWSSAAAVVLFGFITISVPSLLRSRQVSMPAFPVAGPIEPLNRARPGARAAFGSEAEEQTPFQTRTGDTGGTVLDSTGEAVNESPLPTDRNARAELSTVSVEAEERAFTSVRTEVEVTGNIAPIPAPATGLVRETASRVELRPNAQVADPPSFVDQTAGSENSRFLVGVLNSQPVAAPPPPMERFAVDRRFRSDFNTEEYNRIVDNPFVSVFQNPLATFSVDVDTASYANVRRFLNQRTLPPPDAVRIEEMVNYFRYDYEPPRDGRPVRVHTEAVPAPWNPEHRLVRIGIRGEDIAMDERAATNLVFLIDVSGSMNDPYKLPLLVDGMKLLVEQLGENDSVAIVVYAGASGLVLRPTTGDRKPRILRALEQLSAGGSTNGGAGIQLAYDTAVANFIDGGVNRVILATDGDFNVGVTNSGELTRLIEEKARTGVFLSVLGFGTGNFNDAGLEALADRGNGNYAYIDGIREARKVLVQEVSGTLFTIAKDVKFQVEFNPVEVTAYRLIGYENRVLRDQDFNDDTKDAGEIGAGHTVTALFEVVPAGVEINVPGVDPLRYQAPTRPSTEAGSGEMLRVKIRYKEPDGDQSQLIEAPFTDSGQSLEAASSDYRFASAVAAFGMILRKSPYKGSATFDSVVAIAESSQGTDPEGYRAEFLDLVRRARAIRDLDPRD